MGGGADCEIKQGKPDSTGVGTVIRQEVEIGINWGKEELLCEETRGGKGEHGLRRVSEHGEKEKAQFRRKKKGGVHSGKKERGSGPSFF